MCTFEGRCRVELIEHQQTSKVSRHVQYLGNHVEYIQSHKIRSSLTDENRANTLQEYDSMKFSFSIIVKATAKET